MPYVLLTYLFQLNKEFSHLDYSFFWWAVGAFTISFIYVFLRFISSRQTVYLYYSLYIFLSIIYCFCNNEIYAQELLNSSFYDITWKKTVSVLALPLFTIVYLKFVWRFIDREKEIISGYKFLKILIHFFSAHFVVLSFLLAFGFTQAAIYLHNIVYFTGCALFILLFIEVGKYFNKIIAFVYIGSIFLFLGNFAFSVTEIFGIQLPTVYSPITILTISTLIEITVFLTGLGHRELILNRNFENTQAAYIFQLQQNAEIQANTEKEIRKQLNQQTQIIAIQQEAEIEARFHQEFSNLKVKALRSQMSPHFLFNSLNTLKLMVLQGEEEKIEVYFSNFTALLRKILEHSRAEKITLAEELKTIKLYVSLEKERFSLDFDFILQLSENINPEVIAIPPLLLQPFIENAIGHGLLPLKGKSPTLTLNFDLKDEEDELHVTLKDNGVGRKKYNNSIKNTHNKEHKSLGIKMIYERIELLNKQNPNSKIKLELVDLKNENKQALGTAVYLIIPV